MASPPTKRKKSDHTAGPTARDIEASNATARFVLGTAQRSWMNTAAAATPTTTIPADGNDRTRQGLTALYLHTSMAPTSSLNVPSALSVAAPTSDSSTPIPATTSARKRVATEPVIHATSSTSATSTLPALQTATDINFWNRTATAYTPTSLAERDALNSPLHQARASVAGQEQELVPRQAANAASSIPSYNLSSAAPSMPTPVLPQSASSVALGRSSHHSSPQLAVQPQFLPSPAPSEEQIAKSPYQTVMMEGTGRSRHGSLQTSSAFGTHAVLQPSLSSSMLAQSPQSLQQQRPMRASLRTFVQQQQQQGTPQQQFYQRQRQQQHQIPSQRQHQHGPPIQQHQHNHQGVQPPPTSQQTRLSSVTTNPFSIFSAPACLPRLHAFLARGGLSDIDRQRLHMLHEAATLNDCFFMVLSLLITSRRYVGSVFPITNPPLDPAGIAIAERIIGPNADTSLSAYACSFMHQFPMSLTNVRQTLGTINFQRICDDIALCIAWLLHKWEPMIKKCNEHKYLPLAQDLLSAFSMTSICLQRAAFRAIIRITWGTDIGHFQTLALAHFLQEQTAFFEKRNNRSPDEHYNFYRNLHFQHASAITAPTDHSAMNSAVVQGDQSGQQPRSANDSHLRNLSVNTTTTPTGHGALNSAVMQRDRGGNLQQPGLPQPLKLLIPHKDAVVRQFAHPDFTQLALHQAHLRDAVCLPVETVAGASTASPARVFRYVSGFALEPQSLNLKPVQEIKFSITTEDLAKIPRFESRDKGAPPVALFNSSSLTFRLRCCETSGGSTDGWIAKETVWPTALYFNLNGNPLEIRRKLQHARCLPVDITRYLQQDNILKIYTTIAPKLPSPSKYAVGIEIVTFVTKEVLKHKCLTMHVRSAKDIQASMVSSLATPLGKDDDYELAITDSSLTIPLFEPYSNAKIFDIPVRGVNCVHRHAFDLDIFLETRACEGGPNEPSITKISKADDWKCPICGGDARPQSLIVDGFLQQVRAELEAKDLLKTRTIVVAVDGSYKIKPEAMDPGDSDDEMETHQRPETSSRRIEVIEIDSD